jgi:hypothetical protein
LQSIFTPPRGLSFGTPFANEPGMKRRDVKVKARKGGDRREEIHATGKGVFFGATFTREEF